MNSLTILAYMVLRDVGVPLSIVVGLFIIVAIVWVVRVVVLAITTRQQ